MKILFIEDEPEISRMLTDYLSKENFEVICAADGQDANSTPIPMRLSCWI